MTDDREPLGRAAFAGHVSGLAEQDEPPWQERPPAWDEISEDDREFYMRIGAAVAAAERERIAGEIAALREALKRHAHAFTDPRGAVLCGGCLLPAPCPDAGLTGLEAAGQLRLPGVA